MDATFEGFLPVFGGMDGDASIRLDVTLKGLEPDSQSRPRIEMDLADAKVTLKGAALPFDVDSARKFFPKTTMSFDPLGKLLETDAPDIVLPIRLPGMDVKRFPELCFLPVEFPANGAPDAAAWTFNRNLNGVDTVCEARLTEATEERATIQMSFKQDYTSLESEAYELVLDEKDAGFRVRTQVSGEAKGVFDRKKGLFTQWNLDVIAESQEENLRTAAKRDRKMKTTVRVTLLNPQ